MYGNGSPTSTADFNLSGNLADMKSTTTTQTAFYAYSKTTSSFNTTITKSGQQPNLAVHDILHDEEACSCCKEVFSIFNKRLHCWKCNHGVCAKHLTQVSVTRSKQCRQICKNCWDEIQLQSTSAPISSPQHLPVENINIDDTSSIAHDYKIHPLAQLFKVAVTMGSFVVSSSAASASANLQSFTLKRVRRNSISQVEHEMTTNATSYVTSPVGHILIDDDAAPNSNATNPSTFSGRKAISTLVKSLKRSSRAAASSVAKTVAERRNAFTMGSGSPVADESMNESSTLHHDMDPCIVQKEDIATWASPANTLPVAIAVHDVNHHVTQPSSHGLHKTGDDASSSMHHNHAPWSAPTAITLKRESFTPSKPTVVTVMIETTAMEELKTQGQKDREELQSLNKRVDDLEGTLKQTNEENALLGKQLADATAKISALPFTITTAIRRDDMVFNVDNSASVEPCVHACVEEKNGQEVDKISSVTAPVSSATTSTSIVRRNAFIMGSTEVVNKQLPLSSTPVKHHPASTHVKSLVGRPSIFSPPPTPLQPKMPFSTPYVIVTEAPIVDVRVPTLPTLTPALSTATYTEGALASSATDVDQSTRNVHANTISTLQSQPMPIQSTPSITIAGTTPPPPTPVPRPRPLQTSTSIQPPPLPLTYHVDAPANRKSPKAKFNPLWQLPTKRGTKPARYIPPRSPSKKLVAQRVYEYSRGLAKGRLPGGGRLDTAATKTTAASKGLTKDAAMGVTTSSLAYPSVPMQAVRAGVGVGREQGEASTEVAPSKDPMDPLPESSSELMQSIRFGVTLKNTAVGNATTKTINTTNSIPCSASASHSVSAVAVVRGAQEPMEVKRVGTTVQA